MNPFRRPVDRYGSSAPVETPYHRASQEWDRRIGEPVIQARNWRAMAFAGWAVCALAVETMRAAGLSGRKTEYLLDLARHFSDGTVHVSQWQEMEDEAIISELVAIRGIGRWTAEMFLIFHLLRPNVLPLDDPGLIRGISENYFSGEPVSRAEARELGEGWSPYRSVATWYLWRSLDPLTVDY